MEVLTEHFTTQVESGSDHVMLCFLLNSIFLNYLCIITGYSPPAMQALGGGWCGVMAVVRDVYVAVCVCVCVC